MSKTLRLFRAKSRNKRPPSGAVETDAWGYTLPIIAGGYIIPKLGCKPKTWTCVDAHYETLRKEMSALFADLGLAAA